MKILHVILGKAAKERANGVNQVIAGMAKFISRHGVQVSVLGMAQTAAEEGEVIERDGFSVTVFTKWSRAFQDTLRIEVASSDVVHLHGTYSPFNVRVGNCCDSLKTPYVVTLHGGLSQGRKTWRNTLQKQAFHQLVQKRHLERAALVHILTEEESTEALAAFQPRAMAVIPNGVDLEEFPIPPNRHRSDLGLKVGYIGRISREKNLDALCEAFSAVNTDGKMQMHLAGPISDQGEALARRWSSYGVSLVGPRFGPEKLAFFDDIDLFVHPSKTDVFSIGAMEALARGVPMVISRTSDTSHFAETGSFIMCEPTAFGIERALRKAISRRETWPQMSRLGRQLVETRLNWDAAASDLISAYEGVLGH